MNKHIKKLTATIMSLVMVIASIPWLPNIMKAEAAITVFSQTDSRWGDHPYGKKKNSSGTWVTAYISGGGCGILSLVNAVYYMNGNFIDPISLADYSVNNGYRVNNVGTSHALYPAYSKDYGSSYGFSCSQADGTSSWTDVRNHLNAGGVAIASIKTISTESNHLLVVADYDSSTDKYLILDSYSSSYRGTTGGYAWRTLSDWQGRMVFKSFTLISNTSSNNSCSCSTSYAGNYVCTTSSANLSIRSGHGIGNKVVGYIPPGATVYVSKASGVNASDWAHVEYNGISGFASMEYLRSSAVASHWLDVNCEVDGTYYGSCEGFGTADIYVNDICVGSNVSDYYSQHQNGCEYLVDNIVAASGYKYVGSSSYSGVLNGDKSIVLKFQSTRINATSPNANTKFKVTISTGGTEVYFAFTPTANREHVIYSVNEDSADPMVTLYDANGEILATNDDAGDGSWNFRLAYQLTAGTQYYYGIKHHSGSATGEIKVHFGYTYSFAYHANGGSGSLPTQKVDYGETFAVCDTIPTRNGYSFLGWATSSTATSAELFPGETKSLNGSAELLTIDLYAVWSAPTSYVVSYYSNGGTGAPSSQTITAGSSGTVSSTIPIRLGYTFLGWSTSSSASSATYTPGSTITPSANTSLYAVWKQALALSVNSTFNVPITYSGQVYYYKFVPSTTSKYVIYSLGSADTVVTLYDSSGAIVDSNDDGGANNNFRFTYTFNSGATYYLGINYHSVSTVKTGTIPVKFGQIYTISYNANEGSGAPSSQTKDYGATLTLTSDKPTRSGYTFLGWSTSNSATSATYSAGGSYTSNSNATLYAVWSNNGYTITYDSSMTGGTGYPASQTKAKGSSITLSTVTPTKSITVTFNTNGGSVSPASKSYSLEFDSWFDSYAETYYPGETYSTDANLTLYAGWKSATGTFPAPTRSGYQFDGWYTSASGGVKISSPSGLTTDSADTSETLYAHWSQVTSYTISYNAKGGSGAPNSQSVTAGSSTAISSTIPSQFGYTFLGWSTSSSATSATYLPGASITPSGNITLYAVWVNASTNAPSKFDVSITYNGQVYYIWYSPTTTAEYVIYSTSTGEQDPCVTLYDSDGNRISSNDDISYPSNKNFRLAHTLSAGESYCFAISCFGGFTTGSIPVTFGRTYTVSYNANGGSGAPSSQAKDYGTALTLSTTTPTRTGYKFLGWSTSSSATSATYSAGGSYTSNSNATLYAVWEFDWDSAAGSAGGIIGSDTLLGGSSSVSGTITSYNSNTDTITVALYKDSSSTAAYSTTVTGNSASYSISGVTYGTYTMKVSKSNHVSREYTVTVADLPVAFDVKIYLRGDVNMSGSVNTTDALWVQQYYAGKRSLSDYALLLADANQSNTVNTTDALWIKQQYAGIRDSAFNRV